jgi:hypothetical protein
MTDCGAPFQSFCSTAGRSGGAARASEPAACTPQNVLHSERASGLRSPDNTESATRLAHHASIRQGYAALVLDPSGMLHHHHVQAELGESAAVARR